MRPGASGAEEQVSSEDSFRRLVEGVDGCGLFLLDVDGTIATWNAGAQRLKGYSEAEAVGQHFSIFYSEDQRAQGYPERELELARTNGRHEEEAWRVRKDGSQFWANVVITALYEGDTLCGYSKFTQDMTGRKRSEAKFEGLLEAAPDAIIAVDGDGVIHLANRQAEVLFGYQRQELLGQSVDMLVPLRARQAHPTHRAGYFANPSPRPMGAKLELTARRRDGSEFPVDISLSSLATDEGVLVSAAVRDVSERKKTEEERAALEKRLVEATLHEERARLEARLHQSQRLETVGQLAGGIAHDFNNLLAAIMNYCSLVSSSLTEELIARGLAEVESFRTVRADVEEIANVAKRAAALTHQLLIFSRREVIHPVVLDLNSVVADIEKLLKRTIGEDVSLVTTMASALSPILADRGQVEQVLMNLAVNARDAMPSGGVLTIETSQLTLAHETVPSANLAPGDYVQIAVQDTGGGMDSNVLMRAFEPFFTTKARGEGSGLGLATVYGIVTQAGGDVLIDSEPGFGTNVVARFPVAVEAVGEPRDSTVTRIVEPGRGETILLVEDEDMVREPTRRLLAKRGYTVLAAATADEADTLAAQNAAPIDLLLTDVVMPGRSGRDLADGLRNVMPDLRVIFMSGYTQDVFDHNGAAATGALLIEKPFSADELLREVRAMLDQPRPAQPTRR